MQNKNKPTEKHTYLHTNKQTQKLIFPIYNAELVCSTFLFMSFQDSFNDDNIERAGDGARQ